MLILGFRFRYVAFARKEFVRETIICLGFLGSAALSLAEAESKWVRFPVGNGR